jgi:hypothetical protein
VIKNLYVAKYINKLYKASTQYPGISKKGSEILAKGQEHANRSPQKLASFAEPVWRQARNAGFLHISRESAAPNFEMCKFSRLADANAVYGC